MADTIQICDMCDTPLSVPQVLTRQTHCGNIKCKLEWQNNQRKKLHQLADEQRKNYEKARDKSVENFMQLNQLDSDKVNVVELPFLENKESPPSTNRIASFKLFLEDLVNSLDEINTEQKINAPNKGIAGAANTFNTQPYCATCQGKCCSKGREFQAFIQRHTMKRVIDNKELGITGENIVSTYISHVPEKSITNSCLFHTAEGCVLPNEIKADICGDFYCDGLSSLISLKEKAKTGALTVVVNRDKNELISVQSLEK